MSKAKAFSLVELSIVLIIIGLLVGGATAGSKLVNAAKIKGLMGDVEEYKSNFLTFRVTYDAVPGDIAIAEDLWGASTTDNGNGDGVISHATQNYEAFNGNTESTLAPHHVSLAGINPGISSGGGYSSIGVNVETTRYGNNTIIYYQGYNASNTGMYGNKLQLGSSNAHYIAVQGVSQLSGHNSMYFPQVKVADAYNIDRKYDDGKPFVGKIFGAKGSKNTSNGTNVSNVCTSIEVSAATTSNYTAQTYNVATPNNLCHLSFAFDGNFSFK